MPAVSVAQQQAAGAALASVRAGKRPRNFGGAGTAVIREFASTKHAGLPKHKAERRRKIAAIRGGL